MSGKVVKTMMLLHVIIFLCVNGILNGVKDGREYETRFRMSYGMVFQQVGTVHANTDKLRVIFKLPYLPILEIEDYEIECTRNVPIFLQQMCREMQLQQKLQNRLAQKIVRNIQNMIVKPSLGIKTNLTDTELINLTVNKRQHFSNDKMSNITTGKVVETLKGIENVIEILETVQFQDLERSLVEVSEEARQLAKGNNIVDPEVKSRTIRTVQMYEETKSSVVNEKPVYKTGWASSLIEKLENPESIVKMYTIAPQVTRKAKVKKKKKNIYVANSYRSGGNCAFRTWCRRKRTVPTAMMKVRKKRELTLAVLALVGLIGAAAGGGAGALAGYYTGKNSVDDEHIWFSEYDQFYRKSLTEQYRQIVTLAAVSGELVAQQVGTQTVLSETIFAVSNNTYYIDHIANNMDRLFQQLQIENKDRNRQQRTAIMLQIYFTKIIRASQLINWQLWIYYDYVERLMEGLYVAIHQSRFDQKLITEEELLNLIDRTEQYLENFVPEFVVPGYVRETNYMYKQSVVQEVCMTSLGYEIHFNIPIITRVMSVPMSVYNIHRYDLPVNSTGETNSVIRIASELKVIVFDQNYEKYASISTAQITLCVITGKRYYQCPFEITMRDVSDPVCEVSIFLNQIDQIRRYCRTEIKSVPESVPPMIESFREGKFVVIQYQEVYGNWTMDCPGEKLKTIESCKQICILTLECRCVMYMEEIVQTDQPVTSIGPSLQICDYPVLKYQKSGIEEIGRKLDEWIRDMETHLNQSRPKDMEREDSNLTSGMPYIPPPSKQIAKTQQARLKMINMDKIQKEVEEKFDEDKYYGKNTPRLGGPVKSRPIWMTAVMIISAVILGVVFMYCCYKVCVQLLKGTCRTRDIQANSRESVRMSHQSPSRQRRDSRSVIRDRSSSRDRSMSRNRSRISESQDLARGHMSRRDQYNREMQDLNVRSRSHPLSNRESIEDLSRLSTLTRQRSAPNRMYYTDENREIMRDIRDMERQTYVERGVAARDPTTRAVPTAEQGQDPRSSRQDRSRVQNTGNTNRYVRVIGNSIGSAILMDNVQPTYGKSVKDILNEPSILEDRSWFIFGINVVCMIIGLIVLLSVLRKYCGTARNTRYHVGNFMKRILGRKIETKSRIYVEISNYTDIVYIPIMEIGIMPNELYYMKKRNVEPKMELKRCWFKSKLCIKWDDACMVAHSGIHRDIYFQLPRVLTLPWTTTWTVQSILKGPYITNLLISHPYTFMERMKIILITRKGAKLTCLPKARKQSQRNSKMWNYCDALEQERMYVQNEMQEQCRENTKLMCMSQDTAV